MSTHAASFEHVSKVYTSGLFHKRQVQAVRDVSLFIEPGQVFGLLGPNRAGKTTLVKMLLSLCKPTEGTVNRLGRPLGDRATLARIGYMHENHAFPSYLHAAGLLEYYGALSLVPPDVLRQRVPELLERVGLADRAAEPISRFSKGMVQRLGLAQALINDPELLVLDEPSEGLDLSGRKLIREVAADLKARGRTVLIVSHVLTEVEQICDRVAVLKDSRLAKVGSIQDLTTDPKTGEPRPLERALEEIYDKKQKP